MFGDQEFSLEEMRKLMLARLQSRPAILIALIKQLETTIATLEDEIPKLLTDLHGEDVGTDDELSEDAEIKERRRIKALKKQKKLAGVSSSSSSSEVVVEEMDINEINQKLKEEKEKKKLNVKESDC